MDSAPATPSAPERELLGVGALFSAGTVVTLGNAGALFGVWAVAGLPPQLLALALGARLGLADKDALDAAIQSRDWNVLSALAAVGAVSLVFGLLGHTTVLLLTTRAHQGRALSLGDAILGGAGRMLSAAVCAAVAAAAVFAGSLALLVPGLYLTIRLSMAVCATVAEDAGPLAGAARSWALTAGHAWDVSIRMIAFVAVAFAGMIALAGGTALLAAVAPAAGGVPAAILVRMMLSAFQFALTAWVTACMTKLFLELAARKDRI